MDEPAPTVFIVDDDQDLRESLEYLMHTVGIPTKVYCSARQFLADLQPSVPGCLVCDVRMPEMSGLELFEQLIAMGSHMPVILMTAYADVPMAIRALENGAKEFIEKPFNAQVMLEKIQRSLAEDAERRRSLAAWEEFGQRVGDLTEKEMEILELLLDGAANKVMATRLGITERAIEARRASVMKKLNVNSLAELIRLFTEYEILCRNGVGIDCTRRFSHVTSFRTRTWPMH